MKSRFAKFVSVFLVIVLMAGSLPVRRAVFAAEEETVAETEAKNDEGKDHKERKEEKTSETKPSKAAKTAKESEKVNETEETPETKPSTTVKPAEEKDKASESAKNTEKEPAQTTKAAEETKATEETKSTEETTAAVSETEASKEEPVASTNGDDDGKVSETEPSQTNETSEEAPSESDTATGELPDTNVKSPGKNGDVEGIWISSATVTIEAPTVGGKPDYNPAFPEGANYYSLDTGSATILNDVSWYDVTTSENVNVDNGVFQAGHQYKLTMYLAPKKGYYFTENSTATVNGNKAETSPAVYEYHQMDTNERLRVVYLFPMLSGTSTDIITSVNFTIEEPTIGKTPSYTPTYASDAKYYSKTCSGGAMINDISWYDMTDRQWLYPGSPFQANHQYQVQVYLSAKSGYTFNKNQLPTVKVNGHSADEGETYYTDGQIYFQYSFSVLSGNTSQKISSASVTITAPQAGSTPAYTASLGGNSYTLANKNSDNYRNGIKWYDVTSSTPAAVNSSSGTFQGGRKYEVEVYLTPKEGYYFDLYSTATLNNQKATYCQYLDGMLRVVFDFSALPVVNTAITSVALTLTAPAIGAKPVYTATLGSGANCVLSSKNSDNFSNGIRWYDVTGTTYINSSTSFQVGHSYRVEVYLTPNSGYAFNSSTKATVNNQTANPSVDGTQLKVTYTFPELKNTIIASVGLTMTAPALNGKPSYTANLSASTYALSSKNTDNFSNGIRWYDVTGTTYINSSTSFQSGHTYKVEVYLTPKTGYAFNSSTKATVNNQTANPSMDGSQLKVTYQFQAIPSTAIASVGLTLTAPSIGGKPAYTASLAATTYTLSSKNSDNFSNGIRWTDVNTGAAISSSTTFQVGHSYKVEVYLTPKTGYTFNSSTKATVNSQTATPSLDSTQLKVTFTFPALTNTAIASVGLTMTEPAVGAKPAYTATLSGTTYSLYSKSNDNYSNGIRWTDVNTAAAISSSTSFQAGHTYKVEVYLTPKTGYAFNSSTKATVNNQTAEPSMDGSLLKVTYTFKALPETPITAVGLTLTAPSVGAKPAYTATLAGSTYSLYSKSNDNYSNGIRWWDVTGNAAVNTSNGAFQAGHTYKVEVYLTPKTGYAFNSSTKATLNNQTADPSIDGSLLKVTYTFKALPETAITAVGLTFTAPSIGAKPAYTATLAGTNYALSSKNSDGFSNGIRWSDGSTVLSSSSVFQTGHSYKVEVYLSPATGYIFNSSTKATVNNQAVMPSLDNSLLKVTYTFPALNNTAITSVGLTLTAPSVAAKPVYSAILANGANYTLSSKNNDNYSGGIRWWDVTGNAAVNTSSGSFLAGHTYKAEVYLTPKTGYAFSSSLTAIVNNQTANASIDGSQLKVTYQFQALPSTPITAVAVTITEPSNGKKPAYSANMGSGANYTLSSKNTDNYKYGIRWWDLTTNSALNTSSGVFQAGHNYKVEIYLTAKSGYCFNSSTTATINNQTATRSLDGSQLMITYSFIRNVVVGDTVEMGDFIYTVTNAATDGTGTLTLTGVTTQTAAVVIPPVVDLNGSEYIVNRIGPRAFYGNKVIRTLSIGANVVVIDGYAFYGCSYLTKVAGGARLRTIGARAFAACIRLKTFVITSRSLSKIGAFSFYNDRSLKVLYIRNTVSLTKAGVKKSLKGSRVKVVRVKKAKVKKYKKIFKKKNSGKSVKVKR